MNGKVLQLKRDRIKHTMILDKSYNLSMQQIPNKKKQKTFKDEKSSTAEKKI